MRRFVTGFLFVLAPWSLQGGIAPYTERPAVDFDHVLKLLEPYGHWERDSQNHWVYRPAQKDYQPMTRGRWHYTDFGWYWEGEEPFSWATDHYGYWVLQADGRWVWRAGSQWHPACVRWAKSGDYVGWSPCRVVADQDRPPEPLQESEDERRWRFLSQKIFWQRVDPAVLAGRLETRDLLEKASPLCHTLVLWRPILRPGPDPKELARSPGGGWQAFSLFSLPSLEHPLPTDRPQGIFAYRPRILQDDDGIQRRISYWQRSSPEVDSHSVSPALAGRPRGETPPTEKPPRRTPLLQFPAATNATKTAEGIRKASMP
ncbi:conserved hypothetical protein [Candidatus Methylacidithermus pantelleriae]|uniref:Uncharacterized protein n=1 Tax=Candidatus Methylacidithermus pantelleriae TaxID=2744239 RepID=A0A8J2FUX8_9BACT|nr:conserved hypothetical protein [Candidatus Methylacidithermus pantelleriae]